MTVLSTIATKEVNQLLKRFWERRRDEEGFTLIELMVVVLIIAILIAIAIPTFLGARPRAQDRAAQPRSAFQAGHVRRERDDGPVVLSANRRTQGRPRRGDRGPGPL